MQRFKRILVVCQPDGQPERALERARQLAHANGAEVTLIDVVDFDQKDMAHALTSLPDRSGDEMQQVIFDYHRGQLEHYARALSSEGIPVRAEVLAGVPFVEIIRKVTQDGHDIVLKGASQDPARRRSTFLGLDMHLMRKCPCPVFILSDPPCNQPLQVLAAVDPAADEIGGGYLNRLIMDLATSVAAASGAHLHVIHAWRIEEELALLNSSLIRASAEELKQIKRQKRARRARELNQLLSYYPNHKNERDVHVVQGHAGEVVPKLARRLQVDLVVMGTVSHTDVGGLFIGSTAETIIGRLECSVLAVKPLGFRTPVDEEDPVRRDGSLQQTSHEKAA